MTKFDELGLSNEEIAKQMDDGSFYDIDYFNGCKKSNYPGYGDITFYRNFAALIALRFRQPLRVLDIGCAKGFITMWLRRLGIDAYGIEISKWAVDNAPEEIMNYVLQGDIRNIKFPEKFFEVTICLEVLEHILDKDLDKAVNEVCRICKNFLIISVPVIADESKWKYENETDVTHVSMHTKDYWIKKFSHNGFNFIGDGAFFGIDRFKKTKEKKGHMVWNGDDWEINNLLVFERNQR